MSEETEDRGDRPVAGWYPDPWIVGQHRYWDGSTWTGHAFPNGTGPSPGPASSPWLAPSESPPPPPAWDAPVPWTPWTPPPPPLRPASAGGWRMPTGVAFAALLLAVGLFVGFLATISTYYALGGRTKRVVSASAATTIPSSPGTTAPLSPLSPLPNAPTLPGGSTPGSSTPGSGTPSDPGGTASCATSPPATVPGEALLSGLIVSQADVPSTVIVQPLPCGNLVTGQTTLDLCNGTYPSESLRTARRQVAAIDDVGTVALSTEAVLYSNAGATSQAFSELKATAAKCPSTPVVSPVGEPTVTTRFGTAPDGAWPQVATVERLAYEFDSTDNTGQTNHSIAVYLRRGRALMGVYFSEPAATQLSVRGQTSTAGIVNVFAQRMAQLPASAVNG